MRVEIADGGIAYGVNPVFSGVNAVFEAGRITALSGPSGSGKSSLLAAIAGYIPLAHGRVSIVDSNGAVGGPDPQHIAWVPQGLNALGARSLEDNVMVAALASGSLFSEARSIARRQLGLVGLAGRERAPARDLSGGELQRLALARALASGKPIILADEPSANLDAANTRAVAEVLAQLAATSTIIVATHDPLLLEAADGVVDLRQVS